MVRNHIRHPAGSVPDPNDPNHATRPSTGDQPGGDFVRRTDGTWTNSGTGNTVPDDQLTPFGHTEPPGDPGKAYEPSFPDRAGRSWRKGPCPPPNQPSTANPPAPPAPPPPPPAHVGANPPYVYSTLKKTDLLIGISAGIFGRTDTYDDNYQAGGITFAPGVRITLPHLVVVPRKGPGYIRFDIVAELPTQQAKRDTTITKLEGVVLSDVMFGIRAEIQKRPVEFWGGFGGGVGVVRSGYDSSGYKYSDTEPLPGITVSAGASTPLSPRLSGFMEVRYIDLFSGTFDSPSGHYNMKDTSISGRIGIQFSLHK